MSKKYVKRSLEILEDANDSKKKKKQKQDSKGSSSKSKGPKESLDDKVAKLIQMDSTNIDEETSKKLLRRAKVQHYIIPEKDNDEGKSVFSKEDWKKFEKELFCSK